jgi:hypothetical protein
MCLRLRHCKWDLARDSRQDHGMTFNLVNALIVCALVGSVLVLMHQGERLFPMIAVVVAVLQALIAFDILELSLRKYRIDVILPALLVLSSAICWSRTTAKTATTAATVVLFVGSIQLLSAIDMLR